MKKWLKRIRGAVGMGLTWAVAWSGVGAIIMLVLGGSGFGLAAEVALFAATGFVGGAIFSTVLGITEGRHRFDQMSLPRFGAWGAVGGLLLSVLFFLLGGGVSLDSLGTYSVVTLLGAGSAAGSLALARRADDRELLEHGEDVGDIGLTEEEKRELLTE